MNILDWDDVWDDIEHQITTTSFNIFNENYDAYFELTEVVKDIIEDRIAGIIDKYQQAVS